MTDVKVDAVLEGFRRELGAAVQRAVIAEARVAALQEALMETQSAPGRCESCPAGEAG